MKHQLAPNDTISQLVREALQLRERANQDLTTGIHAEGAPLVGNLLVDSFFSHGSKGMARKLGKTVRKTSKANLNAQWLQVGNEFVQKCESCISSMSIKTRNLQPSGNSSKLLIKLNKVHCFKGAVPFFNAIVGVLQEIQRNDLIWNSDIPHLLSLQNAIAKQAQLEKSKLRRDSKDIAKLAKTINPFDKLAISQTLRKYPTVEQSILGAFDRIQSSNPDSERHCIASCRTAIESLCIALGNSSDWKLALNNLFSSDTDRKQIKGVWNYLSNKGAHGGRTPTKDEAQHSLKITIASLEYIINRSGG